MLLGLAVLLLLAWIFGFLVFHVAGFFIHLLIIFAIVAVVFHFLRGGSRTT